MVNLAIDIGGTYIKYALIDDHYMIIKKWKVPTLKFDDKDRFYDYLCQNMQYIGNISRIGVSAPGLIDSESYVKSMAAPNVKIMFETSIREEIERRVAKPTTAINDAKAAGVCEFRLGNAQGTKSAAFIIIGTGTGGCLCDENGVINGADSFAGELHFIPYWDNKSQQLLKLGNHSSIRGLQNSYQKLSGSEVVNSEWIIEASRKGEPLAQQAVDEWLHHVALMTLSVLCFYDPEVICFGGEISKADWFIDTVRDKVSDMTESHIKSQVFSTRLLVCKYHNDANLIGSLL